MGNLCLEAGNRFYLNEHAYASTTLSIPREVKGVRHLQIRYFSWLHRRVSHQNFNPMTSMICASQPLKIFQAVGRDCRSSRGFTLLEVMVSLAIISLTLTMILSLLNRSAAIHVSSEQSTIGILLAQEILVKTELGGIPSVGQTKGDFGSKFPQFRWSRDVKSTLFPQVREVFIEVFWGPTSTQESVNLSTYVFTQ